MAAAEMWFKPYIALCAFAGLRQGEAAAVKLEDIDFLRRQLKVTRQVQRLSGGGFEIRPPKYNSERVVFLPEGLLTMLSEHVRTVGVRPEGWLFVGGSGPPLKTTVHRWWRRAVDGAGLVGHHDARTAAFLRQRVDRQRVRCGDGAAGDGARERDDDAGNLQRTCGRPPRSASAKHLRR